MIPRKQDYESQAVKADVPEHRAPVRAERGAVPKRYQRDRDREVWAETLIKLGHSRADVEAALRQYSNGE